MDIKPGEESDAVNEALKYEKNLQRETALALEKARNGNPLTEKEEGLVKDIMYHAVTIWASRPYYNESKARGYEN